MLGRGIEGAGQFAQGQRGLQEQEQQRIMNNIKRAMEMAQSGISPTEEMFGGKGGFGSMNPFEAVAGQERTSQTTRNDYMNFLMNKKDKEKDPNYRQIYNDLTSLNTPEEVDSRIAFNPNLSKILKPQDIAAIKNVITQRNQKIKTEDKSKKSAKLDETKLKRINQFYNASSISEINAIYPYVKDYVGEEEKSKMISKIQQSEAKPIIDKLTDIEGEFEAEDRTLLWKITKELMDAGDFSEEMLTIEARSRKLNEPK